MTETETRILPWYGPDTVNTAADIIQAGGLVAIPTETVYGLGANGLDASAVLKVFEAKGRPRDNPLILHVAKAGELERFCENIPAKAWRLALTLWPGPLTMVLPCRDIVPKRTTAGLSTVAVRCPDHWITRAIIEAAGVPVAAPSANRSGRPSCTTVRHVLEDMDGRIDAVVDGGDCKVGVESTIIDFSAPEPRLLRPGGMPLETIRRIIGEVAVDEAVTRPMEAEDHPKAPGMKYRHYAPRAPVTVVRGDPEATAWYIRSRANTEAGVLCFSEYVWMFPNQIARSFGAFADQSEQAQRVFGALRSFDKTAVTEIWAQCPNETGLGRAVANRLFKAAGFHVIDLGAEGED